MTVNIVGLAAYYHDASCCLLRDGELACGAEEERFSRRKHDPSLPWRAFRSCLEQGGITLTEIDRIAFYEDPAKKLSRQVWMGLHPSVPEASRKYLLGRLRVGRVEREIREGLGYEGPIEVVDHHLAHAASSFYYSGFEDAAVLTVDGVGEWATTTFGRGRGADVELLEEVHFPSSLGLLYSTVTAFLGFRVNDGEYKVMGLAPYGQPRHADRVRSLLRLGEKGQYELRMGYFDFLRGERMFSERLVELFGREPRRPGSEIEPYHEDLACSLQVVLEEVLLEKVRYLHTLVPSENLCMAGGVALNCVANGRILREGPFRRLFVQPAASDAGGALGAAAIAYRRLTGKPPCRSPMTHAYLGPGFSSDEVARLLEATTARALDFRGRTEELLEAVVDRLAEGKVVGWFQGRMEFGPRALGSRSILADPRRDDMRDRINALVKKREAFRPFAPAVLADRAHEHFELDHPSPFMLETCQVRSSLELPAVTHVNGSARVQTVDRDASPRFAALLETFDRRTGCPILLNTSFNMRGEPIVCTPADALACFVRSRMDAVVLEDFVLDREGIPAFWPIVVDQGHPAAPPAVGHQVYTLL